VGALTDKGRDSLFGVAEAAISPDMAPQTRALRSRNALVFAGGMSSDQADRFVSGMSGLGLIGNPAPDMDLSGPSLSAQTATNDPTMVGEVKVVDRKERLIGKVPDVGLIYMGMGKERFDGFLHANPDLVKGIAVYQALTGPVSFLVGEAVARSPLGQVMEQGALRIKEGAASKFREKSYDPQSSTQAGEGTLLVAGAAIMALNYKVGQKLLGGPKAAESGAAAGTRGSFPPASAPVGRRAPNLEGANRQLQTPPGAPRNAPGEVYGRDYSGHAFDQMQNRGLTPSVVEDTVRTGAPRPGGGGTTVYTNPANNVTVVIDSATGRVVTAY